MNIDSLSPAQQALLVETLKDVKLVDLGGYDGNLAFWLLRHGAGEVLVVDKERAPRRMKHNRLTYRKCYFTDLMAEPTLGYRTALLSYPINNESASQSLVYVLQQFYQVVYIGQNHGVTVCGTSTLWRYLITRKMLQSIEAQPNTVIVYGPEGRDYDIQPILEEEHNGLHMDDPIVDAKGVSKLQFE